MSRRCSGLREDHAARRVRHVFGRCHPGSPTIASWFRARIWVGACCVCLSSSFAPVEQCGVSPRVPTRQLIRSEAQQPRTTTTRLAATRRMDSMRAVGPVRHLASSKRSASNCPLFVLPGSTYGRWSASFVPRLAMPSCGQHARSTPVPPNGYASIERRWALPLRPRKPWTSRPLRLRGPNARPVAPAAALAPPGGTNRRALPVVVTPRCGALGPARPGVR